MRALKKHLFNTPLNSIITIIIIYLLYKIIPPIINWAIIDANYVGSSKMDCIKPGACWPFITNRINQFMIGFYPHAQAWRVLTVFGILILLFLSYKKITNLYYKIISFIVYTIVSYYLLYGGVFNLSVVPTPQWGGLMLTLILAGLGIILAFPIAIVLALGRRSKLPIIKTICVAFIELIRGVPLISVLFMASVMLPLFLPLDMEFNKLLRAIIGITFFQAAYLAEVIRGGLQAIPNGQYEAAKALGLNYFQTTRFIILPQALRLVIPGIVNTFIALFKDTTLVLIIGLYDFLGIVQAGTTDVNWLGTAFEGYIFAALVYFVFCYSMSHYSQKLERRYNK